MKVSHLTEHDENRAAPTITSRAFFFVRVLCQVQQSWQAKFIEFAREKCIEGRCYNVKGT